MKKYYRFAGVEVSVSIPEKWMYQNDKMLGEFQVSQVENPHCFHFEIVEDLAPPVGNEIVNYPDYCVYSLENEQIRYINSTKKGWEFAHARISHRVKEHCVQVKVREHSKRIGVKTVLNAMGVEHLVIEAEGVIFHAAYIDWNGKAVLFTAPSGTGKSTQAGLWQKYRQTEIINGDRAVIRIMDGKIYAAGIPFAGSSEFCKNQTLPIVAIVYLQQAPATNIYRMNGMEAFRKVWEGCTVNTWNKEDLSKAVDIVQDVISKVPVFHLACTPDESAVLALEQAIKDYEQQSRKEQ